MTRKKPSINALARWLHAKGYRPFTIAQIVRYAQNEWTLDGMDPTILSPEDVAQANDVLADSQPNVPFDDVAWGSPIGEPRIFNGLDDRWKPGPDPCFTEEK